MGVYGLSSMAFALLLALYTSRKNINRKYTHLISLILGGLGFISMYFIPSPEWLILSFSLFIVIPQIIAAIGGINFTYKLFGEGTINAMLVAGISLIIAGLCNLLITNENAISYNSK